MNLEWMLADAVITYGSSFGYVAAAWAGRPAHYLQHPCTRITRTGDAEVRAIIAVHWVITVAVDSRAHHQSSAVDVILGRRGCASFS